MPIGQVIQMLLPDGDPNGVKIVGLSNWTGKTFIIPRAKLKEIKGRADINDPAFYILLGEEDDSGRREAYIGETENFYKRLLTHDDSKDFWNAAIVFAGGLDKADVKYLENKAVLLAKKINRSNVINQVEPLENQLSEFKRIAVDDFFEKTKFIAAILGITLFQEVPRIGETIDLYHFKTEDAEASGTLLETGEFIVYANSTARNKEAPSLNIYGLALRRKLEVEGILKKHADGKPFIFTRDYIFTSPSAAGSTVSGRPTNGWIAWKDEHGKTLDENKRT